MRLLIAGKAGQPSEKKQRGERGGSRSTLIKQFLLRVSSRSPRLNPCFHIGVHPCNRRLNCLSGAAATSLRELEDKQSGIFLAKDAKARLCWLGDLGVRVLAGCPRNTRRGTKAEENRVMNRLPFNSGFSVPTQPGQDPSHATASTTADDSCSRVRAPRCAARPILSHAAPDSLGDPPPCFPRSWPARTLPDSSAKSRASGTRARNNRPQTLLVSVSGKQSPASQPACFRPNDSPPHPAKKSSLRDSKRHCRNGPCKKTLLLILGQYFRCQKTLRYQIKNFSRCIDQLLLGSNAMKKLKSQKATQLRAIKAARGISSRKMNGLPFAERMAKRKAEDREIERLRDERLAALIRK